MEVRLLPEFPFGIVFGGLELQCLKTFSALKQNEISVKLLDYCNADDKFDILHIFGNPPSIYEVCFHAKKINKIIISAVCGAPNFSSFRTFIKRQLSNLTAMLHQRTDYARLRFIFQSASHIICLNETETKFISKTYSIPMERLSIIPNGVERYFFTATEDLFRRKYGISNFVLFTGNITKRKNPLRLARVLTKMKQKGVFIGSILSSEIEYASQFEKVISSSPNLLWIKGLSYNDPLLASAYASASIFCLPSCGETQPLSTLEAMACGTPIILGDFPYAYQPPFEKASRCNPSDETSIENCIKMVLRDPDRYSDSLPADYTWERIAEKIVKIYEKVLND